MTGPQQPAAQPPAPQSPEPRADLPMATTQRVPRPLAATAPGERPALGAGLVPAAVPLAPAAPAPGVVAQAGPGTLTPPGAASVRAAAAASPAAVAAAAAPAGPPSPPKGTVYTASVRPTDGRRRSRWLRLLPRLHIGAHVASRPALRQLRPAGSATGLIVGFNANGAVATVRLFGPEPTQVTLVGGLWAARILVFRALATGAVVTVLTGRPDAWAGLDRWATGRDDRVLVRPLDHPFRAPADAFEPALLVYDGDALGASPQATLGPWQAQLTVVPQLTAYAIPAIRAAELVVLQRLADEETAAGSAVLDLTVESAALVRALRDDMLALIDGGGARYVWTQITSIERERFGGPRRFEPPARLGQPVPGRAALPAPGGMTQPVPGRATGSVGW